MPADSKLITLAFFYAVSGFACAACAQEDPLHLHMKVTGRTYTDDKITITAPANWTIAIDLNPSERGAVLRKGKYILRLCTDCGQASGIMGGRFNEIADLVQPWFRSDPLGRNAPCGDQKVYSISKELDRIDFWFKRDPAHPYREDEDDCREPKTTATIWYGSYFAERCSHNPKGFDCGGYFLHLGWFTGQPEEVTIPDNEMAFGLTYEETNLDQLPRKDDPELNQVLAEVTAIVRSVHFKPSGERHTATSPQSPVSQR